MRLGQLHGRSESVCVAADSAEPTEGNDSGIMRKATQAFLDRFSVSVDGVK